MGPGLPDPGQSPTLPAVDGLAGTEKTLMCVRVSAPWCSGQGPLSGPQFYCLRRGVIIFTKQEPLEAGALPRPAGVIVDALE